MPRMKPLGRREIVAGIAWAGSASALAAPAQPRSEFAEPNALVVAGPAGSRLDSWAALIAGPIARALPGRTMLQRQNVGGLDGVTGANQFEARTEPDGSTALLVPGAAALSWLVGEPRAQFDPARWVPLWGTASSAVLVSRVALTPGTTVRVAGSGPTGPDLPALLTLDLLGVSAILSPAPAADVHLVQGPGTREAVADATKAGFEPILTLGALDGAGEPVRDPTFPAWPTATERVRARAPREMVLALQAVSAAIQLEAGLVLPQLTPAGAIASWRTACASLNGDSEIRAEAARLGIRLETAPAAVNYPARIASEPGVLLALRSWLATRYR